MTTKHMRMLATLALVGSSLALAACDDPPPADPDAGPGVDAFVPEVDSGPDPDEDGGPMPTTGCGAYCTQIMANCTGDNAQYADMADCMTTCTELAWPEGDPGATGGNSIQCRIYHGGAPAMTGAAEHCPHAGPTGGGVCGAAITFRTDMASAYTRVDRMGMPAVSTALISSGMKNAYNDASLADDAAGDFVPDLAATLTGIHAALDDDLVGAALTPCSMTLTDTGTPVGVGELPQCFGQAIAPGVTVASLVVPDTLQINPAADAGFPNGRMLADPVIDVTLSVILLDMGAPCGVAMTCGPTTLFNGPAPAPLNPPMNDVAFLTTFPYLAPAHAP